MTGAKVHLSCKNIQPGHVKPAVPIQIIKDKTDTVTGNRPFIHKNFRHKIL